MKKNKEIDIETLKMEDIKFVHKIKLPDGTVTSGTDKGYYDTRGVSSVDFKGKRVLDIGCLNGIYSFYAERKGASEVVSIDINDEQFGEQKHSESVDWKLGYLYAHNKLKSKCKYIFPYSIYNISEEKLGKFDIVLCLGVY
ncbi:hypothetical protein LCGC14_1526510 [marine sediment metagenome]|uniref:Ribosomal RNA methyltransferase FtsJ domain-containing protein n=1 Tax=marine sediment metagenome TaxID=412755 RepID=A0A0F9IX01_9ZZZZ